MDFCIVFCGSGLKIVSSVSSGAELCRSCVPLAHQHTAVFWQFGKTDSMRYKCVTELLSSYIVHLVVALWGLTEREKFIIVITCIFCFIMKNSAPLHPLWSGLIPHPQVNPSLSYIYIYIHFSKTKQTLFKLSKCFSSIDIILISD